MSELGAAGFILYIVDTAAGNSRKIWLIETQGIAKNVTTPHAKNGVTSRQKWRDPHAKNGVYNNTVNNTTNKELAENKFPHPPHSVVQSPKKENPPQVPAHPPTGPGNQDATRYTVTTVEEIELPQKPVNFMTEMAKVFEDEHRQHFKDEAGRWIGFTWQDKEFGAMKKFDTKFRKSFEERLGTVATHSDVLNSWRIFLQGAAKCDKDGFTLNNLFTPSKLWGDNQGIMNKIHAARSMPVISKKGAPNAFGSDPSVYLEKQAF